MEPRIEFAGAVHHIFQRRNNREYIFKKEKKFYLKQIKEYIEAYSLNYKGDN